MLVMPCDFLVCHKNTAQLSPDFFETQPRSVALNPGLTNRWLPVPVGQPWKWATLEAISRLICPRWCWVEQKYIFLLKPCPNYREMISEIDSCSSEATEFRGISLGSNSAELSSKY